MDHIFIKELEAYEKNQLKGKFNLLIIGTFNAHFEDNFAKWYYDRPENEFWCLLPRMLNQPTLHEIDSDHSHAELIALRKHFCHDNKIIIIDIFKRVYKNLTSHLDSELDFLTKNEYDPFDYKKSFANMQFDKIMFTWTGNDLYAPDTKIAITKNSIKQRITSYFTGKNSKVLSVYSPSKTANKASRHEKLIQWKNEYSKFDY